MRDREVEISVTYVFKDRVDPRDWELDENCEPDELETAIVDVLCLEKWGSQEMDAWFEGQVPAELSVKVS